MAEALHIPFYDKAVIDLAAKETGLSEEFIRQAEQKKTSSFLYNLYMSTQNLPVSDQVFIAESDVIRKVAAQGPASSWDAAPTMCCATRKTCSMSLSTRRWTSASSGPRRSTMWMLRDVRSYVLKHDKSRAAYYEHFSDRVWGKAQNYHLAVSSTIGLDNVVDLILTLARERGLGA